MKILITGRGTGGSFQVRGVQLGHAIGATVIPNASDRDIRAHDLVILVKRPAAGLVERIHAAGKPLVWDVVDAWPQPEGNRWTKQQCLEWLAERIKTIKPHAIVAATAEMFGDALRVSAEMFGDFPRSMPRTLWLPHHARQDQPVNPVREHVQTIGYEGGLKYLEGWLPVIKAECDRRRWRFVPAAGQLAELDIVLALRTDAGYAPRHWKSNVKLANAQATGTPIVCYREAGYLETDSGAGAHWADTPIELTRAFDALTAHDTRARSSAALLRDGATFVTLNRIAGEYTRWLSALKF
jgi:hypothetical protein